MQPQRDPSPPARPVSEGLRLPRYCVVAGHPVNFYKIFLALGICVGALATAALADLSGRSPLSVGLAATGAALAGLIGARVYHLAVHAGDYFKLGSARRLWNTSTGGLSVFGALTTFIPASIAAAMLVNIPAPVLWDYMGVGVLAGGFWIRLGCVFNGCCGGRETNSRLGVVLADTHGLRKRRIPVQFMEMAYWVAGLVCFIAVWPLALPAGSYALGVLTWYGAGRIWLESLREEPDVLCGRVRINQVVAAIIMLGAVTTLVVRGC